MATNAEKRLSRLRRDADDLTRQLLEELGVRVGPSPAGLAAALQSLAPKRSRAERDAQRLLRLEIESEADRLEQLRELRAGLRATAPHSAERSRLTKQVRRIIAPSFRGSARGASGDPAPRPRARAV